MAVSDSIMTNSINDILQLNDKGVISIIGAGGKTTLMFELAKELSKIKKKILTTTTTKIFLPELCHSPVTIIEDNIDTLFIKTESRLKDIFHFSAGSHYDPFTNKLKGFTPHVIHKLWRAELFDWIIVEADGAKQKALKASGPHEPVVPENTTHLILVAGLDIVGKPLNDYYVHRSKIFSDNTGLYLEKTIDEKSIVQSIILEMKKAQLFCNPQSRIVFLNKADTLKRKLSGFKIADSLQDNKNIETIITASLANKTYELNLQT
jgi:probable selenium-dependent hydroxylase accessory protein YqeC